MFALISSLNATLAWASKPLIQGCEDGWLPKSFSVLNRSKVPYKILTMFYIIGLVPIITGLDIGTIADYTLVLYNCTMILVCFSVVNMPKVIPELWSKSPFHVKNSTLYLCAGIGVAAAVIQIFMLLQLFSMVHLIVSLVLLIICIVYALVREKSGNINLQTSYDED
jgi:APA family basic amino acid/polyamine antiporter